MMGARRSAGEVTARWYPAGPNTIRPVRVVLQRVSWATVNVDGERIASIGPGLLALVGRGHR